MMISIAISKEWFDEVKAEVEYRNEFYYVECAREYVEVDVDAEQFYKVSKAKGWC